LNVVESVYMCKGHDVTTLLWVKDAVRHGSGHRVQKQCNEADDQQQNEYFEDEPLVVLPDDVLESLERIHEPQERRVRPTVHTTHITHSPTLSSWLRSTNGTT